MRVSLEVRALIVVSVSRRVQLAVKSYDAVKSCNDASYDTTTRNLIQEKSVV